MTITEDGACLYATSETANKVYAFSRASDGSLSEITGSIFDTSAAPWGVTTVTKWTQD
jgi:hypothetical protein